MVSNFRVISVGTVSELLHPFGIGILPPQAETLLTYLDLLLRWNRKINLTAVSKPEEIVQRHFGESFLLSRAMDLRGRLLDIGSGAGFPGLALKVLCPDLSVTLLEPLTKKRAFLKEVARECSLTGVQVLPDRIEAFAFGSSLEAYDIATARAVGQLESLIPSAMRCLRPRGQLALWLGEDQIPAARQVEPSLDWLEPIPIPLSNRRVILVGRNVVAL